MPLPRFQNLPADRQREILDAAAAEFAEHDFEAASFNRIIAAAKISKGAMYYYFADKSDAYGAVMDDVLDRMQAAVADLPEPHDVASFWQTIALGVDRMNVILFSDPRLGALGRSFYRSAGATGETFARLMARVAALVERILVLGQRLGAVRDDVPRDLLVAAAMGMMSAIDRWFAEAMARLPPDELLALAPKTLELTRNLLEPREQTQKGAKKWSQKRKR